jgi:homoserine kinase
LLQKKTGRLEPEDLCIRMIPVPEDLEVVLINPAVRVDTKAAREVLPDAFERGLVVAQTANLARLLCAAYENDRESFSDACSDLLIEPYRKTLIPIFEKVRKTCITAGALAFNISGSGPTMFAIVRKDDGARVVAAVLNIYQSEPYPVEAWVSQIGVQGARILP